MKATAIRARAGEPGPAPRAAPGREGGAGLWLGGRGTDNGGVDVQTWTFTRDEHPLTITRTRTEDGYLLGVSGDGPARSYFFADLGKLEAFQADFEQFLIGTGWTFLAFSPDRRTGRERRHFSRLLTDRRRWWTDGVRPQAQALPHEDDEYEGRRARVRRRSPR